MATFISNSAEETQALAGSLAERAYAGLVLGLVGDLGSGKTQFAKGFARGLGVVEPVLSPTFGLVHIYTTGRLPLYHIDLYRLETQDQIIAAGLPEYLASDGCALFEWWDRWADADPSGLCRVTLECLSETQRRITCHDPGA